MSRTDPIGSLPPNALGTPTWVVIVRHAATVLAVINLVLTMSIGLHGGGGLALALVCVSGFGLVTASWPHGGLMETIRLLSQSAPWVLLFLLLLRLRGGWCC